MSDGDWCELWRRKHILVIFFHHFLCERGTTTLVSHFFWGLTLFLGVVVVAISNFLKAANDNDQTRIGFIYVNLKKTWDKSPIHIQKTSKIIYKVSARKNTGMTRIFFLKHMAWHIHTSEDIYQACCKSSERCRREVFALRIASLGKSVKKVFLHFPSLK